MLGRNEWLDEEKFRAHLNAADSGGLSESLGHYLLICQEYFEKTNREALVEQTQDLLNLSALVNQYSPSLLSEPEKLHLLAQIIAKQDDVVAAMRANISTSEQPEFMAYADVFSAFAKEKLEKNTPKNPGATYAVYAHDISGVDSDYWKNVDAMIKRFNITPATRKPQKRMGEINANEIAEINAKWSGIVVDVDLTKDESDRFTALFSRLGELQHMREELEIVNNYLPHDTSIRSLSSIKKAIDQTKLEIVLFDQQATIARMFPAAASDLSIRQQFKHYQTLTATLLDATITELKRNPNASELVRALVQIKQNESLSLHAKLKQAELTLKKSKIEGLDRTLRNFSVAEKVVLSHLKTFSQQVNEKINILFVKPGLLVPQKQLVKQSIKDDLDLLQEAFKTDSRSLTANAALESMVKYRERRLQALYDIHNQCVPDAKAKKLDNSFQRVMTQIQPDASPPESKPASQVAPAAAAIRLANMASIAMPEGPKWISEKLSRCQIGSDQSARLKNIYQRYEDKLELAVTPEARQECIRDLWHLDNAIRQAGTLQGDKATSAIYQYLSRASSTGKLSDSLKDELAPLLEDLKLTQFKQPDSPRRSSSSSSYISAALSSRTNEEVDDWMSAPDARRWLEQNYGISYIKLDPDKIRVKFTKPFTTISDLNINFRQLVIDAKGALKSPTLSLQTVKDTQSPKIGFPEKDRPVLNDIVERLKQRYDAHLEAVARVEPAAVSQATSATIAVTPASSGLPQLKPDAYEDNLSFEHRLILKKIEIEGFDAVYGGMTDAATLDRLVADRIIVKQKVPEYRDERGIKKIVKNVGVSEAFKSASYIHDSTHGLSDLALGGYFFDMSQMVRTQNQITTTLGIPQSQLEQYSHKQIAILSGLIFGAGQNKVFDDFMSSHSRELGNSLSEFADAAQKNIFGKISVPIVDAVGITSESVAQVNAQKPVYELLKTLMDAYDHADKTKPAALKDLQRLLSYAFDVANDPTKDPEQKLNEIRLADLRSGCKILLPENAAGLNNISNQRDKLFLDRLASILHDPSVAKLVDKSASLQSYQSVLASESDAFTKVNTIIAAAGTAVDKRDTAGFFASKKYDSRVTTLHNLIKDYAINPDIALEKLTSLTPAPSPSLSRRS